MLGPLCSFDRFYSRLCSSCCPAFPGQLSRGCRLHDIWGPKSKVAPHLGYIQIPAVHGGGAIMHNRGIKWFVRRRGMISAQRGSQAHLQSCAEFSVVVGFRAPWPRHQMRQWNQQMVRLCTWSTDAFPIPHALALASRSVSRATTCREVYLPKAC